MRIRTVAVGALAVADLVLEMRGIARCDFVAPADMRVPAALRPLPREVVAQAPARDATG